MDVRSRIERLVSTSYSLKRAGSSTASGNAEYNTFRVTSSLTYDPTLGCFSRESIIQLTAFYLNSICINIGRPLIRGGQWDLNARHLQAFGGMFEYFNDFNEAQTTIRDKRGLAYTFNPPDVEGFGIQTVNDTPREFSSLGNILFMRLNMAQPGLVLDFHRVWGMMTFRICRYFWRLTQPADQELPAAHGFRCELGDVTMMPSDAMNRLTYTPMGGRAIIITENTPILISEGVLSCTGAVTGVYQVEFSGMWGPNCATYPGAWRNNPIAEAPLIENIPEGLREIYVQFIQHVTQQHLTLMGALHGVMETDDAIRFVEFTRLAMAHW